MGNNYESLSMLKSIFHVNICVSNLERSIAFYEQLGFKVVNDFTLEGPDVGKSMGLDASKFRVVFIRLGDDPNATVIDLLEFIDPPAQGQPYPTLNNIGLCRVAFKVDDVEVVYEKLKKMDVEFVAPIERMKGEGGNDIAFVCFKDPDGVFLEIISGM
jgi:glyoxylase I family protein